MKRAILLTILIVKVITQIFVKKESQRTPSLNYVPCAKG